ncbi:MAG: MFS transporter [Alphaproteobacteria bacterium]|nr:MFS transporter [Alphaproteobacteria bacterium]
MTSARALTTLLLVSALFFLVTAATFNALGPALTDMMGELKWSGSQAGAGFSLLGVFCGLTATIPAFLIRHMGVRLTLALGGVVMAGAFACLATAHGLPLYFAGCALAGLGFTLLATVPATYLLARNFQRPAFIFGLYFTLGQGGAVAGPLLYLWIAGMGGWRMVWMVAGIVILLTALLAALLVHPGAEIAAGAERDPEITRESWTVKAALRTPQFAVLAAAYSIFLFVDLTVNAFSIPHLAAHGVGETVAVSLLSLGALINAGGRLGGGLLSRFVDAKILLAVALLLLAIGLLALSAGSGTAFLLLYAAGIGIGSGLTFFASTILLLDYFGRKPNLELFATVNLISTVGSVGPAFAGFVFDRSGSFSPAFVLLAVLVAVILVAVLRMKPPHGAAL